MPQFKKKTPFSGKAKKQQLKSKKTERSFGGNHNILLQSTSESGVGNIHDHVQLLNAQPSKGGGRQSNRYALKFHRETEAELRAMKENGNKALVHRSEKELEIDGDTFFPPELTMPVRPPWNYEMTTAQLEAQEHRYFTEYVRGIEKSEHWNSVSYFELNLETWRQLWRTLEMSDILLVIVDIRFTALMFPPSLYHHVTQNLNKDMVLVLNKVDLAPPELVAGWSEYMRSRYPKLRMVYFTSCPGYNLRGATKDKAGLLIRRRKGRLRMATEGALKMLEACKELVGEKVDLSSWETKIKEEATLEYEEGDNTEIGQVLLEQNDSSYVSRDRFKDGVLTIGCIGQPNVGKSSLLNSLMGRKVVSVSKTPGHTKHFQTIFLTSNVRLCDSPGLVFPSKVPKTLQILMGSFPIAQLREPYTAIRFLAERLDLPRLLRMEHPENDEEWSPKDVCDGWAKKRGYLTAKAGRLDSHRAANSLLRMALDGNICLCLRPVGYLEKIGQLKNSPEIQYIKWVQALTSDANEDATGPDLTLGESDASGSEDKSSTSADGSSDDEVETTAIVNKFAALQSED